MSAKKSLLLAVLLLSSLSVTAQRAFDNNFIHYTDSFGLVYLDQPLVTLPAQAQAFRTTGGFLPSYMNPGMENSLSYSADLYTAGHFALKKAVHFKNSTFWQIFLQRLTISAFDMDVMQMPLGVSWLHEEYHRGVMTQYGVNSFNEVLLFKLGSGSIAVSHETDEDMAMLCDKHHPDFVRLMSAGHEAVVDLNRTLQANEFFYHQNLDNEVLYFMHNFQNLLYVLTCATGNGDDGMRERNQVENTIESRDFTGMDMNAWIHALCYPDKPYAARGIHPSGTGINRYIMYDDIPENGKQYLKRSAGLDLFNFLSPMMFGFSRFRLGKTQEGPVYGNFAFRHYLTAFGDDVSLDLYSQTPRVNLYSSVHTYHNESHHYGGLELGLVDYPLAGGRMQAGGTLMGWVQPEDMLFAASKGSFGGLARARLCYTGGFLQPYAEAGWKTKGWVAGNANLDDGFFCRAGIRWRIAR